MLLLGETGLSTDHHTAALPLQRFVHTGVVGLVYALIFSQQYADAQQRLREIQDNLSTEAGGIHICMNLVRVLDDRSRYMSAKIKVPIVVSKDVALAY